MKTKILKKINRKIRIIETSDGMFEVQNRHSAKKDEEWRTINVYSTRSKAIHRKNNYIVMILMRELGLRNEFVRRRTKRNKK